MTTGNAPSFNIYGSSSPDGNGGNLVLVGGLVTGTTGITGIGGSFELYGGQSTADIGQGGAVTIRGGDASGAVTTVGGSVTISGGTSGTDGNGGSVTISGGTGAGSGTTGVVTVTPARFNVNEGIFLEQALFDTCIWGYSGSTNPGFDMTTYAGTNNVVLGNTGGLAAMVGAFNNILIGATGTTLTDGNDNILIGQSTGVSAGTDVGAIAIGRAASAASHECVIGGNNASGYIADMYIGRGKTSATAQVVSINAGGRSGTNASGNSLTIASGKGTGNATGTADIIFSTPVATSSGATLQTLGEKLRVTRTGALYGTALHNNATALTGTTTQYVGSGTYTPTLTNVTNVAASTAYVCQYMRVGNVVTVSGQVDIDITTTLLASELGMSLPIASAIASNTQVAGVATDDTEQTSTIRIRGDATNDRAQFSWTGQVGTGNLAYSFTFTYVVV